MSFFNTPGKTPDTRAPSQTFLEGLSDKEWQTILKFAEGKSFASGEVLIEQGDQDDSFYIITAGTVEVILHGTSIATIQEGTVFGEMAFFDGQPRSATVRAREPGSAVRLSRRSFENLAAWEPVLARRMLFDLGRALAMRLRWAQRRED